MNFFGPCYSIKELMRGSGNVGLRLRGEGLRVQDFNVEEFVKVAVRVVHASGI